MSATKLYVVFLLKILINAEAARILAYYPAPSISHQVVFRPLTIELLRRGHEVTVITADPMFPDGNGPANLTEIDVHDVSYSLLRKSLPATVTGQESDLVDQVYAMKALISDVVAAQTTVDGFRNLLQNRKDKFDLLMLEAVWFPTLGLTHVFEAPTILVSSFGTIPGNYEALGAPTHLTVYHNFFRQRLYNLTIWEKVRELYNQIQFNLVMKNEETDNEMLRKVFGDDIPPLDILKNNIDMMMLNVNPIWEGNHPVPPNVIHMGGLHQKPPKKLPQDLQNYLDSCSNGVIYFSFGTNVKPSLLPPERMAIFAKVFAQLPYNVIWKWDNENFTAKSKNVKIFKWLPQSDLLRHPNVKVFITQGGLQSTDEAITAGVPLIGVPMLGDQWYNVEKYIYHKIGVRLDLDKINEQTLKDAIVEVVENESYRENIVNLRSMMQDQPQTPLERSMWWIEYALRHKGAKHLKSPTANMSWSEFLELELVGVILLGAFVLLGTILLILRLVVTRVLLYIAMNEKLKDE